MTSAWMSSEQNNLSINGKNIIKIWRLPIFCQNLVYIQASPKDILIQRSIHSPLTLECAIRLTVGGALYNCCCYSYCYISPQMPRDLCTVSDPPSAKSPFLAASMFTQRLLNRTQPNFRTSARFENTCNHQKIGSSTKHSSKSEGTTVTVW